MFLSASELGWYTCNITYSDTNAFYCHSGYILGLFAIILDVINLQFDHKLWEQAEDQVITFIKVWLMALKKKKVGTGMSYSILRSPLILWPR